MPFLAALIPTWRDGPAALATAVRTALTAADAVVVLDGGYEGVVHPHEADTPELFGSSFLDDPRVHAYRVGGLWKSQAQKRNALLGFAHELGATWALHIDADEQLHGGQVLRRALEEWTEPAYPIAFESIPGAGFIPAAFKCFRIDRFMFAAASSIVVDLLDEDHPVYALSGEAPPAGWADRRPLAYITHHPERRPPARRHIRLGELEHDLEPAPAATSIFPIRFPT